MIYSEILESKKEGLAINYGFNFVQVVNMINLVGFLYEKLKVKNPELTPLDVFNKIEKGRAERKIFPLTIEDGFKIPLCAQVQAMLETPNYFTPTNYGLKTPTEIVDAIHKLLDDAYVPF